MLDIEHLEKTKVQSIIKSIAEGKQNEEVPIQEQQNKKYDELLKDKLKSENALRAQAESDKAALIKEWEMKLKEAVVITRKDELDRSNSEINKFRAIHDS